MIESAEVIIVGAGLAGLACARHLHAAGVASTILEASDGVGGRIRTDAHEGFLLDRGFQVLLTAYPEAKVLFDYAALDLQPFYPGALIRRAGRFQRLADPWRQPLDGIRGAFSSIGTFSDKLRIRTLRARVRSGTLDDLFARPEMTTQARLEADGFSNGMIDQFFRPFYGGIYLDRSLQTSSRMFEFTFRMFSEGDIALPAAGMEALPRQLAVGLPTGTVWTGSAVESIGDNRVTLRDGRVLTAKHVVVATEGPEACRLLHETPPPAWKATTCLYFAADRDPLGEPILVLDGDGTGPVNNLCVPSAVAKTYAPPSAALISASVLGDPPQSDAALLADVQSQLAGWFGSEVARWKHLKTYRVRHALPDQTPPTLAQPERDVRVRPGVYGCGDHRATASIQGALVSGRRAAEAILVVIKGSRSNSSGESPQIL